MKEKKETFGHINNAKVSQYNITEEVTYTQTVFWEQLLTLEYNEM